MSPESSSESRTSASTLAPFGLFERYGVELEYMIVDRETLDVRPLADGLLADIAGHVTADVERGAITWSNELVNHVIELKLTDPAPALGNLAALFQADVRFINERLATRNAMLLPTGAHPWMDPHTETRLWPHEGREVYALYDRIFDCRGHGWANLQSTHLNLPFRGDAEFGRLHAAIRVLLPILPALSASTPVLEGRLSDFADVRLEVYRHNQDRIPSLTGVVIPEAVFTQADYHARIFAPIQRDVRPYDTEGGVGAPFPELPRRHRPVRPGRHRDPRLGPPGKPRRRPRHPGARRGDASSPGRRALDKPGRAASLAGARPRAPLQRDHPNR